MKNFLILNDVHLGVSRVAGTTPASAAALKSFIQWSLAGVMMDNKDKDILILGDLFDSFTVDSKELLQAYNSLTLWLAVTGRTLHLVAGNHDVSAKGEKLSSFHFLSSVLKSQFGSRVVVYEPEFAAVADGVYVIPHCSNQDLFELELAKALDVEPGSLLLHCNVMNPFAERSDHSLNLTEEWCERLTAKHHLIVAHEHQRRTLNMGKGISVLGNQFPSSVSDCLSKGSQNGAKFAHVFEQGKLTPQETWNADGSVGYINVDWQELATVGEQMFIRVSGNATAEQAADVITAIAKFRSKSECFIVTNAVVVQGINDMDQMTESSLEQIQSFNVLGALLELLNEKEQKTIKELLND